LGSEIYLVVLLWRIHNYTVLKLKETENENLKIIYFKEIMQKQTI